MTVVLPLCRQQLLPVKVVLPLYNQTLAVVLPLCCPTLPVSDSGGNVI